LEPNDPRRPPGKPDLSRPAYDEIIGDADEREPVIQAVPTHYAPRTGRRLAIFVGCLALLLAIGFLVVHHQRSNIAKALSATTAESVGSPPPVDIVRVRAAPATATLTMPGESWAWYKTTIYARVSGYVSTWLVDIGDRVHKNQLLAKIETPELDDQLAADQAQLKAAEANVEVAETDAEFAKKQYDRWWGSPKGVVSEQEREEKKASYDSSIARVDAAKAKANLDKATLTRLVTMMQFREVTAPFDGVITERRIDLGDLVTAGSTSSNTPLYMMAQIDQLRVFVDVPQSAAVDMLVGTPCDIVANDLPDRVFAGKVTRTSDSIDPGARTLRVEVDIPNKDLTLLPGMYIQARFHLAAKASVEVPATALIFRPDGPHVAIVDDQDKVRFHKVTIARDDGTLSEIGSGVALGDRIVLNISNQIADGEKVTPNEIDTPAAVAPNAVGAAGSAPPAGAPAGK
jgi:RND family efflux transporter MFP subunit